MVLRRAVSIIESHKAKLTIVLDHSHYQRFVLTGIGTQISIVIEDGRPEGQGITIDLFVFLSCSLHATLPAATQNCRLGTLWGN